MVLPLEDAQWNGVKLVRICLVLASFYSLMFFFVFQTETLFNFVDFIEKLLIS